MTGLTATSSFVALSPPRLPYGQAGRPAEAPGRTPQLPDPSGRPGSTRRGSDPARATTLPAAAFPVRARVTSQGSVQQPAGGFSSQQAIHRYQTIGNLPDNGAAEVIPRIDSRV